MWYQQSLHPLCHGHDAGWRQGFGPHSDSGRQEDVGLSWWRWSADDWEHCYQASKFIMIMTRIMMRMIVIIIMTSRWSGAPPSSRLAGTGPACKLSHISSATHKRERFSPGGQIWKIKLSEISFMSNLFLLQNSSVLVEDHRLLQHFLLFPRHLLDNLSFHLHNGELIKDINMVLTVRVYPAFNVKTLPYEDAGPKWQLDQGLIGVDPGVRFIHISYLFHGQTQVAIRPSNPDFRIESQMIILKVQFSCL